MKRNNLLLGGTVLFLVSGGMEMAHASEMKHEVTWKTRLNFDMPKTISQKLGASERGFRSAQRIMQGGKAHTKLPSFQSNSTEDDQSDGNGVAEELDQKFVSGQKIREDFEYNVGMEEFGEGTLGVGKVSNSIIGASGSYFKNTAHKKEGAGLSEKSIDPKVKAQNTYSFTQKSKEFDDMMGLDEGVDPISCLVPSSNKGDKNDVALGKVHPYSPKSALCYFTHKKEDRREGDESEMIKPQSALDNISNTITTNKLEINEKKNDDDEEIPNIKRNLGEDFAEDFQNEDEVNGKENAIEIKEAQGNCSEDVKGDDKIENANNEEKVKGESADKDAQLNNIALNASKELQINEQVLGKQTTDEIIDPSTKQSETIKKNSDDDNNNKIVVEHEKPRRWYSSIISAIKRAINYVVTSVKSGWQSLRSRF